MAKIKTHQIKAQQLAVKLSRQGMFSTYEESLNFAKSVYGELREAFTKTEGSRLQQYKKAWTVASDNFVSTKAGQVNRQRGNEQFRVWLEELKKEPPEVQNDPEIKRMRGIAKRNTGYKGTATRVDLKKGTVPVKNIDTTDMQRVRDLRAQQIQRETTTNITAGVDPSKAPKNLVKAPEQQYPSTTQTPSSAPSRQGEMLRRADLTNPAGVAETKYEKELMDVARKEGKKGLQKKLETDTGVKHSKKSMGAIWKEFKKAIKFGEGTGGIPIGGPSKGGSTPTKNLTGGKLGINDHIKLL
tara:strand:+ start:140 stop:1036 length:897 start_codon:yes stop_codon:yes gene_type:complete